MLKTWILVNCAVAVLGLALGATQVQARASSDVIENITSVIAAESLCGFKVNQDLLLTIMNVNGVQPADLQVGGTYGAEVAANKERIVRLSATEEKRRSLCATIKLNLSAMFD